jgi:hypothetical protein
MGRPCEGACNRRNGDINTDSVDARWGGGGEIDTNVKGVAAGLVGEAVAGFSLDVAFGANKGGQWSETLEEDKESVPDEVVKGCLVAF